MAEGMPPNRTELPGCNSTLLVDRQPSTVRCRTILLAPDARTSTALRAFDQTPSGRPKVSLLNLGRLIGFCSSEGLRRPSLLPLAWPLCSIRAEPLQAPREAYMVPRILRLHVIYLPVHDAPLHEKLLTLEIEVTSHNPL